MSMLEYHKCVVIPRATLQREEKASEQVNHTRGRPHSILTKWQQDFLIDTVRRRDRANDGMSPKDIVDSILVMNPNLTRKQRWNLLIRLRSSYSDVLSRTVTAQATTTKRTGINVAQQFRFYK